MKLRILTVAAFLAFLNLSGCDYPEFAADSAPKSHGTHRNWIDFPALPIIQNAVFSLSPTFGGERNAGLMQKICGLARGELKQAQINDFLRQNEVDVQKVPKKGAELSLLVGEDTAAQMVACAAFLSTSVVTAVDVRELTSNAIPSVPAMHEGTPKSGEKTIKEKPTLQLDPAALALVLPVKLAVARANADIYALIASELQRRPGLSVAEYRDLARQLFTKLAPVYLERIKNQMPREETHYQLLSLDRDGFSFDSSEGTSFRFSQEGLVLRQGGVVWFGQGMVLGRVYFVKAAYFDAAVENILAPEKPWKEL